MLRNPAYVLRRAVAALFISACMLPQFASANINIIGSGTTAGSTYSLNGSAYTQNFDSLPATGTATWANDSTLPGWYAAPTTGTLNATMVVSDGTSNLNDLTLASLGTTGSTERALAYHTRVSTAPTYVGLGFNNNSGLTLNSFTLSYTPEQWRESSNQRTLTFTVQYRVGAATADLNATTGWTTLSGLAFTSLNGSVGATATLTASAIAVSVPNGSTIWFRWVTSNTATSGTSSNDTIAIDNVSASFTASGLPAITTQPASQTVNRDTDVTLAVVATSPTTLSYQWQKGGASIPGATSASLVIIGAQVADSGSYTVVVSNDVGSITSNAAVLTVNNVVNPPTITTQPLSQTANAGDTIALNVVATGTAPLNYQWYKNGTAIANEIADTLTLTNVSASDAASYTVKVTNDGGSVTSNAAVLSLSGIDTPPSIVTQSGSQSTTTGGTVSLSVVAAGTQPFTYQWYKDNVAVAGATGLSLTLTNIGLGDAGSYTVVVSNTAGSVTSTPAVITVNQPPTTPEGTIFVASDGLATNPGTYTQPTTLANAISLVSAGGTIYLRGGTYTFSVEIDVARGNNGASGQLKHIFAYTPPGGTMEKVIFDFSSQPYGSTSSVSNPRGLWIGGNYWHIKGLEVKGAADNGVFVAGNNNIVELCSIHGNHDSGLQLGRYSSSAPSSEWPSNNLILNCDSFDNYDSPPNAGENADGFGCKLTTGPGNVFRGCISHNNIDDGWDLYTKSATGPISPVVIDQCISYGNGTLTDGTQNAAGDKNGFKLGGEAIAVAHYVSRCISFNNGKNGFTWNSNPGAIVLVNNLAWDNVEGNFKFDSGSATFYNNVSIWTTSSGPGSRTGVNDRYASASGAPTGASNIFWYTASSSRGPSINDAGLSAYKTSFRTLTPPTGGFARNADGSINLGDFARPVAGSSLINAGVLPASDVMAMFPYDPTTYYENAPDIGAVESYINSPPTIVTAPQGQSVLTGAAVTFSVSVTGTSPFTYQWNKDGNVITGATSSIYTIAAAQVSDSGSYTVTVTNSVSSVTSAAAVLGVAAPTAPTITTQPAAQTVNVGTAAGFSVAASGTAPFTYQWYKDNVAISGAVSSTYSIAGTQVTDSGSYTVVVTNSVGSATSNAAVLTVNAAAIAPTITTQPASATKVIGGSVTFNVVASGSAPFSYQWKKNGTAIDGATSATLTLANVQATDGGTYTVVVTNAGGSVESSAATLTVNAAPDTVYIADSFADGTRGGQNLPSSAAWWTSSGASNFTATVGAATQIVSSARTILAYFTSSAATPVNLALNQKLTFDFVVQFTGFDSAAGANISNLRVGLLRSPDDTKRFAVDFASGQPATGEFTNYTGYAGLSVANAVGDTIPVSFGIRNIANAGLINTTLAYTAIANGSPAASAPMAASTDYHVTFVVTRLSAGVTLSYQIVRVSDGSVVMTNTVTDTATTYTAFDTAALYFGKASGSSSYNIILKQMNVALGNLAIPTPPTITTQPASQAVGVGSSVTFTVAASGTSPFTYQWHKDGTDIGGATAATLALSNVQLTDAGSYAVTVTNSLGSADSSAAVLTVTAATAPTITTQPQSQTVTAGASASFSVVAAGTAPLSYQWSKDGNAIVGATASSYSIASAQSSDTGTYTVLVTNSAGSAASNGATLTVNVPPPVAPSITTQPASQSVAPGSSATFSVVATGTAPLAYQWSKGGTTISGATGSSYTIANVLTSDAGSYTVVVTNTAGSAISNAATLSVTSSLPVTEFNLTGFATVGSGTTGGGVIPETDVAYRKVYTPQDFVQAIIDSNKTAGKVKVIEIMNDLSMGWSEVGTTVQNLASNPLRAHNPPQLHPVLLVTGVSIIDIKAKSPLTIFSASGVTIKHVTFNVKGTSNIIIRNLKFDEMWEWDEGTKGNYDKNDWDFIDLSNGGDASNVWIDHCTFTKTYDGIVDMKAGTTNVTLSWCKYVGDDEATNPNSWVRQQIAVLEANRSSYSFYNFLRNNGFSAEDIITIIQGHDKTHLMGSNSLKTENDSLTATFHHLWMQNVWDRAVPRLRGGNVHDYNIFVDDTNALAAKRLRNAKAALLTTALQNTLNNTYSFNPPLNGSISTEGGSVLVEKSVYQDCLWPLRNNQTDPTNPVYTGKIKALDSIYHMDNTDSTTTIVRGDSTDAGNPMGPFQATIIPFAWDLTNGVLPYTYTTDDPAQLQSILTLGAGAGVLTWSKDNWLRTSYTVSTNAAPTITAQPQSLAVASGVDATFTVQATGSGTLTYQWKKGSSTLTDGGNISGSTSAVLTISGAGATDAGSYTVTVTNSAGNATSNVATLTVTVPVAPAIATQPQPQNVVIGTDVELSVVASGSAPFTYQWHKDGADLVGATGDSLTITGAQPADAGSYTVTVTNVAGSITSSAALLGVGPLPGAPSVSAASGATFSGFTANWTTATDATAYLLDVATDPSFASFVTGYANLNAGSNLSSALTGLTSGTTYYYRVRATNAYGTSASSATMSVTLPARPTFASFVAANFTAGELTDSTISGAAADPDSDGLSNLLEYAFSLNPKSNDQTGAPTVGTDSGKLTLTFVQRTDSADLTYAVEVSNDLATWNSGAGYTEQLSSTVVDATHNRITVRDLTTLSSVSRRFIRLRVTQSGPAATSATPPLGAVNLAIAPGTRFSGMPLVNTAVLRDKVASQTPTVLTLANVTNAGALLTSTKAYFVEITGGTASAYVGERFEVDVAATIAAANNTVAIVANAASNTLATLPGANALAGDTLVLRPHLTLGQLFGTKGNTPMQGATVASSADQLQLLNTGTQAFETYYLLRNGSGTVVQWTKVGGGSTSQDALAIPAGVGFVVVRNGTSNVALTWLGEVRLNGFARPLVAGNSLTSSPYPIDASPTQRAMTHANGFTGSTVATSADQIQLYTAGAVQTYYLLRNASGSVEQWTKVGGGSTNYNLVAILPADGSAVIHKVAADALFFEPLPTSLQAQ